MPPPTDLAEQIRILATGLAAQARAAGLSDVAAHLEAAAAAADKSRAAVTSRRSRGE